MYCSRFLRICLDSCCSQSVEQSEREWVMISELMDFACEHPAEFAPVCRTWSHQTSILAMNFIFRVYEYFVSVIRTSSCTAAWRPHLTRTRAPGQPPPPPLLQRWRSFASWSRDLCATRSRTMFLSSTCVCLVALSPVARAHFWPQVPQRQRRSSTSSSALCDSPVDTISRLKLFSRSLSNLSHEAYLQTDLIDYFNQLFLVSNDILFSHQIIFYTVHSL